MSSTVVKKENNEVTLKIQVSAEDFEKGIQKAYNKMKGRFNIPGFRKGKAPRKIVELHYGREVFYEEAINEVFPKAYESAIDEHNLEPVDRPSLDFDEIVKGQDVVFTVTVTVKPEVTLGDYKGIEVEKKEYNVTNEDVEKEIEGLRERNARLIAVERPIKTGDTVIIDYAGFVGEEQFEGGTAEKQTLVIGSGTFIPGFEEQLVGANAGDEVEVKVTFPEEYHAENLAGKDAVFKVTVHEVKEKELPELDDEFAKDVSEHDTLEALKEDIKNKQEEAAKKRAERELKDDVVKKVTENVEVDIPEIMIEHQIDDMLNEFSYQLQFQGLNLDTYLQYTGTKMEDMREQMKEDAYNRVKTQLTLEAIGKAENIEVADEDIDKEIENYAKQYNMDVEKFKKTLRPHDLENIKEGIKVRKTVDFLVENAKIA
ncbi:trigger factor [Crassaminicella thermophila]|uniref:Trigger factor n=1 Tax=Crassaminicella thermophila TaxID=2599308 RepID=A0A5C0SEQ5_CRATE|nr:trigger factor [Crassaminicella thermophila]QEK12923.1 trigger factor [Crassaminicella thermophila]